MNHRIFERTLRPPVFWRACLFEPGDKIVPVVSEIGIVLLWASAILTLYTGYDYMRAGLRYMIEDDA